MKLSSHFTLEEMTVSDYGARHGIANTPSDEEVENLRALCVQVLEPLRWACGQPIHVNSGYRCPEINSAIGGSKTSQHMKGMAADIRVPGMTPQDVFLKLTGSQIIYDQAILEFDSWVHVSFNKFGGNRMQKLVARRVDGKTQYEEIWKTPTSLPRSIPATST